MFIRPAKIEEISALQTLIAASVRRLSIGFYSPEQIESALVHVFGVDTQLIADGTYLVAEINQQIVACGGWSKRKTLFGGDQMKSDADNLLDPKTEAARIRAFFIHPDWARQGIGRKLIAACENGAREAGFARLSLAATLPGEPLYRAAGYQVIERWEHQLPENLTMTLVRMEKTIWHSERSK